MKHLLITFLFLSSFLFATPIMAGAGHEHDSDGGHSHGPISSDSAIKKASQKVAQLADAGKIDASWAGITAASIDQKEYSKGPEWVISFKNNTIKDVKKQTLYLFFSLDGHYIAANYSGN